MDYQLILFDLDDTLFEWYPFWKAGMMAAMKKHDLTREIEAETLFAAFDGFSLSLWPDLEQGKLDWPAYRRMRFMKTMHHLGREADERAADDFMALFHVLKMDFLQPNPAVVQLISELQDRYHLGIVTNGPADQQYLKVKSLELGPFFADEAIFVSEEVGFAKPDPRIFRQAHGSFCGSSRESPFCRGFLGGGYRRRL